MVYILDDNWDTERMVIRAGSAAFGLYVRCGMWCARQYTDGVIPLEIAAGYGSREWIRKLVEVGFWESHADGYLDLYFLQRNPTAVQAASRREQRAERQRRWLENRNRKRRVSNASTDAPRDTPQDASTDALHLLPSLREGDERARSPSRAARSLGPEDPRIVAAEQQRLANIAHDRSADNAELDARARNGAAVARAVLRKSKPDASAAQRS